MAECLVAKLTYQLKTDGTLEFLQAPPVYHEAPQFNMSLASDCVIFEFTQYPKDVDEARNIVEPFLTAWEIETAFANGDRRSMWFDIVGPEWIYPDDTSKHRIGRILPTTVAVNANMAMKTTRCSYPHPPSGFTVTPDVETLWMRFLGYKNGREPLPSAANFFLTFAEMLCQNDSDKRNLRLKAGVRFGIDKAVLSKMGEMAAKRGDRLTARKAETTNTFQPLTPSEVQWLEILMKKIIIRTGMLATNPDQSFPSLKMSDLPVVP